MYSLTITHNIDNSALNNIISSIINIVHLNFTGFGVVFKCYFFIRFYDCKTL